MTDRTSKLVNEILAAMNTPSVAEKIIILENKVFELEEDIIKILQENTLLATALNNITDRLNNLEGD